MAHFAQLDDNNIVSRVIVVSNSDSGGGNLDTESVGISFCKNLLGSDTNWKQTSYNGSFRGNYAGIGFTYMTGVRTLGVASTDIFIGQGPPPDCPSWGIGVTFAEWESPIGEAPGLTTAEVRAGKWYSWDETAYQSDNTTGWALTT